MRVFECAFLVLIQWLLLAASHAGNIVETELPKNLSKLIEVRRQYVATTDQGEPRSIKVTAKRVLTLDQRLSWWIDVVSDDIPKSSLRPDMEPITGKNGLLIEWLGRFLVDEPDANLPPVEQIEILLDLRASTTIWMGLTKELTPLFKKWQGVVSGAEVKKRRVVLGKIGEYLQKAPESRAIADRVAKRLDCALLIPPGILCEAIAFEHERYDISWPDLLKRPHLGIVMNGLWLAIDLKPKPQKFPTKVNP